jgi:hypothetical protein
MGDNDVRWEVSIPGICLSESRSARPESFLKPFVLVALVQSTEERKTGGIFCVDLMSQDDSF